MRGSFRVKQRVARVTVRIEVTDPSGSVDVTDVMLQPGSGVSGWLPHVHELPWSGGIA